MFQRLFGFVALLVALLSAPGPGLAGVDEAYLKPAGKKSWGELLADFIGHRGFGRSYALVVGISDFEYFSSLPTANDPLRMRDFLIDEAGFDYVHVLTGEKATAARINELMQDILPAMIDENDQFLFYWSGHGETRARPQGGFLGYLPLASSPKGA
jgi:Caspase domain